MMTEMIVVRITARSIWGPRGALASVPSVTARSSSCVFRPTGSAANSTVHQMMKKTAATEIQLMGLHLFQFDQGTQKILGMQKQHRLAVCADPGGSVAQHARSGRFQPVAGGDDVFHLVAKMMHAPGRVLLQECSDRGALTQRLEQLDLGVAGVGEHDGHAMLRQ